MKCGTNKELESVHRLEGPFVNDERDFGGTVLNSGKTRANLFVFVNAAHGHSFPDSGAPTKQASARHQVPSPRTAALRE
jgi:hypothetical protein